MGCGAAGPRGRGGAGVRAPRLFAEGGLRFGVGGRADGRSQATETRSLRAAIRPAHPVTAPATRVPSPAGTLSAKTLALRPGSPPPRAGPVDTPMPPHGGSQGRRRGRALKAGDRFARGARSRCRCGRLGRWVEIGDDLSTAREGRERSIPRSTIRDPVARSGIISTVAARTPAAGNAVVVPQAEKMTVEAGRMATRGDLVSVACEWPSARPHRRSAVQARQSQREAATLSTNAPKGPQRPGCRRPVSAVALAGPE